MQKIVVICGPTGVGKTGFAIELARRFSGQIVGADSMQIYRRMTIGTAKPTAEEQAAVRHHLVDFLEPDQPFDAAAYAREADKVLAALDAQNILPMVVGGTGLYIKALLYGLLDSRPVDPELRRDLRRQAEKEGPEALHRQLARKDPPSAARIHPNDTYRIIRALEILATTGQPLSELRHGHGFAKPRYTALQIGLDMPRDALYHRIDQRVDLMLSQGLEQEVRALLEQGFDPNLKSMQSLGYRHMVAYLQKRADRQETLRTLKRDHRRYAKRQLTWFRADPGVQWVQAGDVRRAEEMIRAFLSD
ncbi:MAG: tRNA (adenosine(37)-N6)-dimethylallyltransferase MiaA [Desulfosarcinaceae bacterium]